MEFDLVKLISQSFLSDLWRTCFILQFKRILKLIMKCPYTSVLNHLFFLERGGAHKRYNDLYIAIVSRIKVKSKKYMLFYNKTPFVKYDGRFVYFNFRFIEYFFILPSCVALTTMHNYQFWFFFVSKILWQYVGVYLNHTCNWKSNQYNEIFF